MLRPGDLASISASKLDALKHCVTEIVRRLAMRFDVMVDLDPTSPLRLPQDVDGAVALQNETGATSVMTAAKARKSPYFNLVELRDGRVVGHAKALDETIHRGKVSPCSFDMNAAVYVWKRDALMTEAKVFYDDTRLFEMPPERSHDIDTPIDFEFVSLFIEKRAAS